MILERSPIPEILLESKMVKCALAVAKRKKNEKKTIDRSNSRKESFIISDLVCDDPRNELASGKGQLFGMGKLGDKTGNGDANQRYSPLLEPLPDPPDSPRVPFSSMPLCNQDAG